MNDYKMIACMVSLLAIGAVTMAWPIPQDAPTATQDTSPTITAAERRLWDAIRRRADTDDPPSQLVADFLDYGHDAHGITERQIAGYDVLPDPNVGLWAGHYADWIKWRDSHPKKGYRDYVYDWSRVQPPRELTAEAKATFTSLLAKRRAVLDKRNAEWRKEADADKAADKEFFGVTK